MKYFLVSDCDRSYDGLDFIAQKLYSANSSDELFQFIYNCSKSHKITEDDLYDKPKRDNYKTESGYKQALRHWRDKLGDRINQEEFKWKETINDFENMTQELDIPCQESEMKLIQSFTLYDNMY